MHLTCTNMPRESLKSALDKARGCDNAITQAARLRWALTVRRAAGQV